MSRGKRRLLGTSLAAACAMMLVAACGSDTSSSGGGSGTSGATPPKIEALKSLGPNEGELNLVVWAGYAEDGTNDPNVDWVHPFEQKTGCTVNAKLGNTSDEMVQLMKTGQYDGVSASGDATLRLIYGGDVAPVNTDLVPSYKTIAEFLKNGAWNSVGGQMYGIPHGWGANLLMWNSDKISGDLDSWSAVFDKSDPYKGGLTAYDSPIYIADAALYLKATQPSLGIKDPYSLTEEQLNAAVDLLKKQNANIGEYWSSYTAQVQAFESGAETIGTSWQVIANLIDADGKVKIKTSLPKEGSTGWSDTWMISSKSAHPNCMYAWMDWISSPEINAQVAEWFGEAPAQTLACQKTSDPTFCDQYHALDANYAKQIYYWTTPQAQCVDGSGTNCTDYAEWTNKWQEIKG